MDRTSGSIHTDDLIPHDATPAGLAHQMLDRAASQISLLFDRCPPQAVLASGLADHAHGALDVQGNTSVSSSSLHFLEEWDF